MKYTSFRIYDASGRLVNDVSSLVPRYTSDVTWNGTDQNGQPVPAGVYFLKAETATDRKVIKIIKSD